MQNSNCQKASTAIYTEAEELIYKANTIPSSDTNLKLTLYLKARTLLDKLQQTEKKEYFRNIYKQRMNDVTQKIKSIQLPLGNSFPQANSTGITSHNSTNIAPALNAASPKNSQALDLNNSFSLYPTLPDINFDGNSPNFLAPTINLKIMDSNKGCYGPKYIPYHQIPQTLYLPVSQTKDFSTKNQIHLNNNTYQSTNICYSPILPLDYPVLQDEYDNRDYPMSIPTIIPQIVYDDYNPLSQPEPFPNCNNDYNKQKKDSYSDSSNNILKRRPNTEILNENIMLNSKDHDESDQENNNLKKCNSLNIDLNDKKNPDDPLVGLKIEDPNRKKKKRRPKKEAEPKLSENVIDIQHNFRIESFLCNGTFGNIFLATENATNKKFVIKELKDFETKDETSFLREIEALSRTHHPAVLRLYGYSLRISKEKRYPAIVTEYLPGGTLLDIINGKKTVSMTEKLILLYGICEAMHYLHDKLEIVHRDLKPKNILLNSNNEPIVSDFGLSKAISTNYMMKSQKARSPKYTAPELLNDYGKYSNKVDVYSYGIIAYELLTGKMAYSEARNAKELEAIVLSGKRPPLDNETNLHKVFKDLIQTCWDENEASRPTFYDLAKRFRKMEFVVGNCNKTQFRIYVKKCLNRT